jgi:Amt family ammonium transporter
LLDFAGGIAVHNIAGMVALASVLFVGRRRVAEQGPHSIPLVALGTGLLWFGWYGFNAGSELQVDAVTVLAFANTDIAASFAAISWLLLEWKLVKKPRFVGLLTGAVAGLATITPAAGYVQPWAAALIGLSAGIVCFGAVSMKNRLRWDDALDVWGVHGVGGALGIIMLGLLGTTSVNPGGADGLFYGGAGFFLKELAGVIGSSAYAFIFTYAMLWIISRIVTVKTTEDEETTLDESLHGESAYVQ